MHCRQVLPQHMKQPPSTNMCRLENLDTSIFHSTAVRNSSRQPLRRSSLHKRTRPAPPHRNPCQRRTASVSPQERRGCDWSWSWVGRPYATLPNQLIWHLHSHTHKPAPTTKGVLLPDDVLLPQLLSCQAGPGRGLNALSTGPPSTYETTSIHEHVQA